MLLVVTLGAGCKSIQLPEGLGREQAARGEELAKLSPEEATKHINFTPGDTFELRQTMLGFGAALPELLGQRDGVKMVTVKRFAPMNAAALDWSMELKRETDESRTAREAYERARDAGETATLPATRYESKQVSGSVKEIGLRNPHSTSLPASWPEGELTLREEQSALWLSDDAYLELSRTGLTTLNLGVFDDETNRLAQGLQDVNKALSALRTRASEDGKNHDLTLLKADAERVTIPLEVNGTEVKVTAIRAKNWFGEITVLDNRQNPLVLQLKINPLSAGLAETLGGSLSSLDQLLGYEIKKLRVQAP
jgi:hypothetical protein